MPSKTAAYKVLTHDLRAPVRGGPPVFDGHLPFTLPTVEVNRGDGDCAAGWNACRRPEDALRIAGLWPNGRPSRLFRVETDSEVVERGDKLRAATWTVVEEITDLRPAIEALSVPFECPGIVDEQIAWRSALARPMHDPAAIEAGLRAALDARGLSTWRLRRFESAGAAWAAWDARDAGAAWAAWDARVAWAAWDARVARVARAAGAAWAARAAGAAWAAWDARDAGAAGAAWAAWDARDAGAAWAAWDARVAWAARDAGAAWDARVALTVFTAGSRGWTAQPPGLLTAGLRPAYEAGLAIALPVAPETLGWVVEESDAK